MNRRAESIGWTMAIVTGAFLGIFLSRTADGQTAQTKRVMQQKLAESQQLLAALATSNWGLMMQRTQALQALPNQPGWQVLRTKEFREYTASFQKATQALAAAATRRDQQSALTAYNQLVTSCVECHRYVARARVATAR